MVYGKTIKLPGEFFDNPKITTTPESFLYRLQKQMELFKPVTRNHGPGPKVFVHKDLNTCSHVFVRVDATRKPMEPVYEGPFKVLERKGKYFVLEFKNRTASISTDRIEPAYMLVPESRDCVTPGIIDNETDTERETTIPKKQPTAKPLASRSGRQINRPVRFNDNVGYYE
ncbi:hypothetical protein WN55_09979 [Dufourea novaeangliae]|uniref:Uncharacterized protein n=1 Tax=Dufourea novaeangliae TaxID=178035 RepID=A0A154P891_DUFNO|nr:hypothetical protein WN55_09979 [Dufourea novaeangliae]